VKLPPVDVRTEEENREYLLAAERRRMRLAYTLSSSIHFNSLMGSRFGTAACAASSQALLYATVFVWMPGNRPVGGLQICRAGFLISH